MHDETRLVHSVSAEICNRMDFAFCDHVVWARRLKMNRVTSVGHSVLRRSDCRVGNKYH